MATVVAIGGGEIGRLETLELDAEIVRLAGKKRPRVVFLPTATADDRGYVTIVEEHYGRRLGCDVVPLPLFDRSIDERAVEAALLSADVVYVGGGNTLRMMKLWRRRGVDRTLRRAAANGTVLAGISAGAICWCSFGISDSRSFTSPDESWDYITVKGLGLVEVVLCPHFDADPRRRQAAVAAARRRRLTTIGLDDCTALQVVDDRWRIVAGRGGGAAHLVDRSGIVRDVAPRAGFSALAELVDGE